MREKVILFRRIPVLKRGKVIDLEKSPLCNPYEITASSNQQKLVRYFTTEFMVIPSITQSGTTRYYVPLKQYQMNHTDIATP